MSGVRYRAALERGIYTRFHGGSVSALCVDLNYEDPRTKEEKRIDLEWALKHPKSNKGAGTTDPEPEIPLAKVSHGIGIDGEAIEIDWDISPIMVGYWSDEPRLVDFETHL